MEAVSLDRRVSRAHSLSLDTDRFLWAYTALLLLLSWFGFVVRGWSIALRGPFEIGGGVVILAAIGAFYNRTGRSDALARASFAMALLIALAAAGIASSYLAVTSAPLWDARLTAADAMLGFSWSAWADWLLARPRLFTLLAWAYNLHLLETVLVTLWLAILTDLGATMLLRATAIAHAIAAVWFALMPALGNNPGAPHVPDILAIRTGTFLRFDLLAAQGVGTMPSFHAVLATLVPLCCWQFRAARWPLVCLNGLMMIGALWGGGHYLVDLIVGMALAFVSFRLACRSLATRRRSRPLT